MSEKAAERWNISICGLNCAQCDIYQAGHGNKKLRDEIVKWFQTERNETIKPEQVRCDGCTGATNNHWSPDCKILRCAKKRGQRYCFQCDEFLCTLLKAFSEDAIAHHKRTVENLKQMRKIGLAEWIAEQERKRQIKFCP